MADELFLNDYNAKNQDLYIKHPVVLSENKESGFYATTNKAQVNLKFADRSADMNKRVIR